MYLCSREMRIKNGTDQGRIPFVMRRASKWCETLPAVTSVTSSPAWRRRPMRVCLRWVTNEANEANEVNGAERRSDQMIERAGGGQAIGLSIGVIVGCATILILIFSGRLVIAERRPSRADRAAGTLPEDGAHPSHGEAG